jgi:hypothetical protein
MRSNSGEVLFRLCEQNQLLPERYPSKLPRTTIADWVAEYADNKAFLQSVTYLEVASLAATYGVAIKFDETDLQHKLKSVFTMLFDLNLALAFESLPSKTTTKAIEAVKVLDTLVREFPEFKDQYRQCLENKIDSASSKLDYTIALQTLLNQSASEEIEAIFTEVVSENPLKKQIEQEMADYEKELQRAVVPVPQPSKKEKGKEKEETPSAEKFSSKAKTEKQKGMEILMTTIKRGETIRATGGYSKITSAASQQTVLTSYKGTIGTLDGLTDFAKTALSMETAKADSKPKEKTKDSTREAMEKAAQDLLKKSKKGGFFK